MSDHIPQLQFDASTLRPDTHITIITAEWNSHITHRLREGAIDRLAELGVSPHYINLVSVPGAVELTYAAAKAAKQPDTDAIIVFGCVIRGDTPHFDYVCQSVTQGVTTLNARGEVPVIFGLLTVENEEQALQRIGGIHGHKGIEAAEAALRMTLI